MPRALDDPFLRRALRLAMNGRGRVEPNPMVGCVLAHHDRVIGEGWHAHYGGPHAEPNALADCRARGHDSRGATAYVTLEPCCHTNKQTPPCAPRLIEAGIARVVIGCPDPNPDVNGKGVAMLRAAGVAVDTADDRLAPLCLQLIAPFRSPPFYTTLKWAESADGKIAGAGGMPVRITGPAADGVVHRLRTRCDAIAVGSGTALLDDPALTIRGVDVIRRPIRIVFDRSLSLSPDCRLLTTAGPSVTGQPVVVLTTPDALARPRLLATDGAAEAWTEGRPAVAERIRRRGGRVVTSDADDLRSALATSQVVPPRTHLLIEPGARLVHAALPWADRLWVFHAADVRIDSDAAPRAAVVPPSYIETGRLTLGPDTLVEYLNRDAASYVTATPSADFVLEAEAAVSA